MGNCVLYISFNPNLTVNQATIPAVSSWESSTIPFMGFLADRWRRIGTRLYIALGFAVFLTLVSSAVGVYYFEQSGDLNFNIRSESMPVLEAAWSTERETAKMRSLGLSLLSDTESDVETASVDTVESILGRLEPSLQVVNGVAELNAEAEEVFDGTYDLAGTVDEIQLSRNALTQANEHAVGLRSQLDDLSAGTKSGDPTAVILYQALAASDQPNLDALWDEFVDASAVGGDQSLADLAGGPDGIFAVRGTQILLQSRIADLSVRFDLSNRTLEAATSRLVNSASGDSYSNRTAVTDED